MNWMQGKVNLQCKATFLVLLVQDEVYTSNKTNAKYQKFTLKN